MTKRKRHPAAAEPVPEPPPEPELVVPTPPPRRVLPPIAPELRATVAAVLAPIVVAAPLALEDAVQIRATVLAAVGPEYEVEAYHRHRDVVVEVRLLGALVARREIPCAG